MSLPLPFPARRSTALIELTDALVVFAVAAGVGLRIWILVSSPGTVDGDEGVWGLMIRHVLDGEWPAFYWGQAYGGTQEVFLSAPVVALFGLSPITIRIAPIGLWAVASVLVWRVGRRTIGEPQARLAAGLFWLWPTYFLWKSTRAHGFYGSTLVLGLVVLLLVLRLRERPSRRDLVLLGLALGCGWWASPQIAIVALPAVVWLVWQRPGIVRGWWLILPSAAIGALPWLVANVRHDWYSFDLGANDGRRVDHLHNLFAATLPTALGLRLPFSLAWVGHVYLGSALYLLALAGFAWLLVRRRGSELGLLTLTALVFPAFYVISPYTWLNVEPRYLAVLSPVLALLVGLPLATPRRAAAVLAVALSLSIVGVAELERQRLAAAHAEKVEIPDDISPLLRTLRQHDVKHAFASYWVAWRLTFETDEQTVVATTSEYRPIIQNGRVLPRDDNQGRYPSFYRLVLRDRNAAHIFAVGGNVEARVQSVLRRAGYRRLESGGFAVYLPPASTADG